MTEPADQEDPKYFTVDEANRTLPLVRRIVEDVVSTHQVFVEKLDEHKTLDAESTEGAKRRAGVERDMKELADTIDEYVGELQELGAQFKGFEPGLVDFYSVLDGRPIFLCWRFGEDRVEWWHEIEAGYAGRQRLPEHLLSPVAMDRE